MDKNYVGELKELYDGAQSSKPEYQYQASEKIWILKCDGVEYRSEPNLTKKMAKQVVAKQALERKTDCRVQEPARTGYVIKHESISSEDKLELLIDEVQKLNIEVSKLVGILCKKKV